MIKKYKDVPPDNPLFIFVNISKKAKEKATSVIGLIVAGRGFEDEKIRIRY